VVQLKFCTILINTALQFHWQLHASRAMTPQPLSSHEVGGVWVGSGHKTRLEYGMDQWKMEWNSECAANSCIGLDGLLLLLPHTCMQQLVLSVCRFVSSVKNF